LVVVAHGQPVLHEVGDLVARIEGQEGLELLHRLVELSLAVERFPQEEAGPRRPRRVRVPLDDLAERIARLDVAPPLQLLLALRIELIGQQDRRRSRAQPGAPARYQQQACEEETCQCREAHPHEKVAHTYSTIAGGRIAPPRGGQRGSSVSHSSRQIPWQTRCSLSAGPEGSSTSNSTSVTATGSPQAAQWVPTPRPAQTLPCSSQG